MGTAAVTMAVAVVMADAMGVVMMMAAVTADVTKTDAMTGNAVMMVAVKEKTAVVDRCRRRLSY